jgi:glycosyltransferase involved in cell wall biosynthesis
MDIARDQKVLISVIIPAREEEDAIEQTIRQFEILSIPHEIIVSDGKSTDRTVEIARAAGARVVLNESGGRSPSKQRNDGARLAGGEYVLFIDVTVILPDIESFIQNVLKKFENEAVVGIAMPQWIYPEIATLSDRFFLWITNIMISAREVGSGKFIMARKSAFDRIGGFCEELVTGEDHDVFERLKNVGTVFFAKDLYVLYAGRREHEWGWPKLLYTWIRDEIWIALFKRSGSKDWMPVR